MRFSHISLELRPPTHTHSCWAIIFLEFLKSRQVEQGPKTQKKKNKKLTAQKCEKEQ